MLALCIALEHGLFIFVGEFRKLHFTKTSDPLQSFSTPIYCIHQVTKICCPRCMTNQILYPLSTRLIFQAEKVYRYLVTYMAEAHQYEFQRLPHDWSLLKK